jgi:hypothetical protein
MTVLRTPQKLKHQPSSPAPRRGPHSILTRLWKVVAISLLIDPLLWSLPHPILPQAIAEQGALLCALLTIPFLNQVSICNRVSALRRGNKAALEGKTKRFRGIFLALLLIALVLKPLMVGRVDNVATLVLVAFLVLGAIKSAKHAIEKEKASHELFKNSPWSHISQWEAQLVTILGAPMMFARAVSLLLTLGATADTATLSTLVGFLVSATLMTMLKPERRFFIGFCGRCKHPVPIVFVDYGSCPLCDERLSTP